MPETLKRVIEFLRWFVLGLGFGFFVMFILIAIYAITMDVIYPGEVYKE